MNSYALSHLTDGALLRDLAALVAKDRHITAALLAHIAEVDARRLYVPAAYSSMYDYCVGELHLSEDAACKRIRAARAARQFPAVFAALASGQLHLSGVVLLAPYLTPETAVELLATAAHKTKSEIGLLLAGRFPRPDVPTQLQAIAYEKETPGPVGASAPGRADSSAPGRIDTPTPRSEVAPLSPQRFALQLTMSQGTHDKLRYAQALLSHQIPSRDVAQVLDRALDALIRQLEKRKFGATDKPRLVRRRSTAARRHIPAEVKRAVWERDQGRCTFESETGHRCAARTFLEFDHMDEVARGGRATTDRMRLVCRAHNQYTAERTFGAEFMNHKRQAAQRTAAEARAQAAVAAEARAHAAAEAAEERTRAAERAKERDVVPWLRQLGFRADEAKRAAAFCESLPNAPLEERVRVALSYFYARTPQGLRRAANRLGPSRQASGPELRESVGCRQTESAFLRGHDHAAQERQWHRLKGYG